MKKVGSYSIDEELIEKLDKITEERRVSSSWLVNEAIIHYLNKLEVEK